MAKRCWNRIHPNKCQEAMEWSTSSWHKKGSFGGLSTKWAEYFADEKQTSTDQPSSSSFTWTPSSSWWDSPTWTQTGTHGTSAIGKTIWLSGMIIGKNGRTRLKCAFEFVWAPGNWVQWLDQELQTLRKQRVLRIILSLFFVDCSSTEAAETGFRTQPATARVRLGCRHYAHPVARRHSLFLHTHHSTCFAHFHVVQVWHKGSVFWFILRHVFASLLHSPRHFPTTLSSPPASTSPPSASSTSAARSRCQSTSAPARWRESGRLADSSPHARMMRDPRAQGNLLQIHNHQYMQKVFQNVQKTLGRSPIHATFSVESYKTNVLTWRLLWHRRWKLPYTLGRISWRIRKSTWIRNSRMSRVSLILHKKFWYRNSLE